MSKYADFIGRPIEGFEDVWALNPQTNHVIRIAEGTADHLNTDDINRGYEGCIFYMVYYLPDGIVKEVDAGQIMLETQLRSKYSSIAECIPEVFRMVYGDEPVKPIIIAQGGPQKQVFGLPGSHEPRIISQRISTKDVAAILGASQAWVVEKIRTGELPIGIYSKGPGGRGSVKIFAGWLADYLKISRQELNQMIGVG